MAKTERERVQREEPESVTEESEIVRDRTRRPISMRRYLLVGMKEGSPTLTKEDNRMEPAKLEAAEPGPPADPIASIAVDQSTTLGRQREHRSQYEASQAITSITPGDVAGVKSASPLVLTCIGLTCRQWCLDRPSFFI